MKEQVFYTLGRGWAKAPSKGEYVHHVLSKETRVVGAEWAGERVEDEKWSGGRGGGQILQCFADYSEDFGY